ncbi:MAG: hypothetical protein ACR2QR_00790 [Woeseiaceae bacterium]
MNSWRHSCLIAISVFALPVDDAAAQGHDDHTVAINLGYFLTSRDTKTRIDSQAFGFGTEIDFEDDLGLDSSDSVFRIDGHVDIATRHKVLFSIYDLSRRSGKVLEDDISYGDTFFPIDTNLSATVDFRTYKISYAYSVLHNESGHLDLSLGAYVADIKSHLVAENIGSTDTRDITAPLPVLGIRGAWYFAERWSLIGSAELFALAVDNVDGRLSDFYIAAEYQAFDNVAFGLGLNDVRINIDTTEDDFTGSLDWHYDGILGFVKVTF